MGAEMPDQFAVHLAFVVRAPIAPKSGRQCTAVKSREFAASGQAHAVDFDQQLARHAQALVDAEGFVEVGSLISPSSPRWCGTSSTRASRLAMPYFFALLHRRRAYSSAAAGSWMEQADHHQQAVVAALDDVVDVLACG
jgi:hypothetical protein